MHHPAGARASHGPTGPLDGTLAPTADPELAELHDAVDQLAAAVAEHTAAIDAFQARIRAQRWRPGDDQHTAEGGQ
jgi:hypothetical protein